MSQAQTYFAGQWQTPKTKLAYLLPCWAEGGVGKLCCEFCGTNNLQIQASLQNLMPWREEERPGRATRETGWGRGPPKRANPLFFLHSFGHRRLWHRLHIEWKSVGLLVGWPCLARGVRVQFGAWLVATVTRAGGVAMQLSEVQRLRVLIYCQTAGVLSSTFGVRWSSSKYISVSSQVLWVLFRWNLFSEEPLY